MRAHEKVEDGAGGRKGVGVIYFLATVSSPVVVMILVQNQIRTFRNVTSKPCELQKKSLLMLVELLGAGFNLVLFFHRVLLALLMVL